MAMAMSLALLNASLAFEDDEEWHRWRSMGDPRGKAPVAPLPPKGPMTPAEVQRAHQLVFDEIKPLLLPDRPTDVSPVAWNMIHLLYKRNALPIHPDRAFGLTKPPVRGQDIISHLFSLFQRGELGLLAKALATEQALREGKSPEEAEAAGVTAQCAATPAQNAHAESAYLSAPVVPGAKALCLCSMCGDPGHHRIACRADCMYSTGNEQHILIKTHIPREAWLTLFVQRGVVVGKALRGFVAHVKQEARADTDTGVGSSAGTGTGTGAGAGAVPSPEASPVVLEKLVRPGPLVRPQVGDSTPPSTRPLHDKRKEPGDGRLTLTLARAAPPGWGQNLPKPTAQQARLLKRKTAAKDDMPAASSGRLKQSLLVGFCSPSTPKY